MSQIEELRRLEAKATMLEQDRKAIERKLSHINASLRVEHNTLCRYQRGFNAVKEGLKGCALRNQPENPKLALALSNAKTFQLQQINKDLKEQQIKVAHSKTEQAKVVQEYKKGQSGLERIASLAQAIRTQLVGLGVERDFEAALEGLVGAQLLKADGRLGAIQGCSQQAHLHGLNQISGIVKNQASKDIAAGQGSCRLDLLDDLEELTNIEIDQLSQLCESRQVGEHRSVENDVLFQQRLDITGEESSHLNNGTSREGFEQYNPSPGEGQQESFQSFDQFRDRIRKLSSWQSENTQGIQMSYRSIAGFQIDLAINSAAEKKLDVVIILENCFEYNQVLKERKEILAVLKEAGYLVNQIDVRRG